ncbi:MAG: hypothetical protein E2O84_03810 [Bacteroidetes bacterium]|nr:MAG: hypothetical protein E2O84_03810 [Bacteroidota bacterium]
MIQKVNFQSPGILFAVLGLALLIHGCAVPIPPSGGPADNTPAVLLGSDPVNASVNVDTDRIIFRFNERLDERSVMGALSIFPEFEQPVDLKFKGSSIEVYFPASLRQNTTYVISFDTRLRDAHGVALHAPVSVAFGTGNTLNTGRMTGSVVDEVQGKPSGSVDIFLYAAGGEQSIDPSTKTPDYRTQTSESGRFSISNIREQEYFVFGLLDQNQNHLLDVNEAFAVGEKAISVSDSVTATLSAPFILARADTSAPDFRQARATFSDEITVRFSEPVSVLSTRSDGWILSDSSTGTPFDVLSTYAGSDTREIRFRTAILPVGRYLLEGSGEVADSSGNTVAPISIVFSSSAQIRETKDVFARFIPDTLSVRTEDNNLLIWPGLKAGLMFESTLNNPDADALKSFVSVIDTSGTALNYSIQTTDGIRYFLLPQRGELNFEGPFIVNVATPDSTYSESFQAVTDEMTGSISGEVAGATSEAVIVIEVRNATHPRQVISVLLRQAAGAFDVTGLPAGSGYFLRAYLDLNSDGDWNPGNVYPFKAPEPVIWHVVDQPVRARWETALSDTLSIPVR